MIGARLGCYWQALGSFALATEAAFAPYLGTVLPPLLKMAAYFHADVRNQVATSPSTAQRPLYSHPFLRYGRRTLQ